MWIAILVSVLLVAAPVHVDSVVDVQAQLDADDIAVTEVAIPLPRPVAPTIAVVHRHETPLPAPVRGRVFRPPRAAFA